MNSSRYEKNIFLQPSLIRPILDASRPLWMDDLKSQRIFFVGIGTSFHAAQIAKWLWRRHVSPNAEAVHSFDFTRMDQPVGPGDAVVLLSHRGSKSFSVEAAVKAHRAGAVTVAVTGRGGAWNENITHRVETCEMEDSGVFTKSFTTSMAWIARWINDPGLLEGFRLALAHLESGPEFPRFKPETDVVLIGDLAREWVAREISLKLQEAAYIRARPFGLEEFLHGPRVSVGPGSSVVAFTDRAEPRWEAVRQYLKLVEVPLLEVDGHGLPACASWLWQVFWGQRLTAAACRRLGVSPDSMRTQDPRYKKAKESLSL
ncbi:MAG: SIS domain-containing protein [Elusimicrobia bacterium]|nr:SIS domain-containing protein [Elusimicrobiota bacterium]